MSNVRSPLAAEIFAKQQAGYPVLAIETYEEGRVSKAVAEAFPNRQVYTYSATSELIDGITGKVVNPQCKWADAFKTVATEKPSRRSDGSEGRGPVLIMFDYQHVVAGPAGYRPLLQYLEAAKDHRALFILVAPSWKLPEELKHAVPVIQLPLPSEAELGVRLDAIETAYKANVSDFALASEVRSAQLRAARGMTLEEAENSFSLSALAGWDAGIVEREKMRLVKSPCMSVEQPISIEALGGLGRLKRYIQEEVLASINDEALRVRGLLLCGIPGTGKSLSAKVTSSLLGWPLVRFDLSAAKGSLMGQSEAAIRNALALADAVSPCVLWMDEIEKCVGGAASSHQTDGGTVSSMVSTLLTWMQEHSSPVVVVATANDYSKLPAELTRAGRFDERFFLDLPRASERVQIARIHLTRLGCSADLAATVAEMADEWTGAEIEQLIKSAARRTARQITPGALEAAAAEIIPMSRNANIKEFRQWASEHLRIANDDEVTAPAPTGRKLEVASDPEHAFPAFQPKGGHFAN